MLCTCTIWCWRSIFLWCLRVWSRPELLVAAMPLCLGYLQENVSGHDAGTVAATAADMLVLPNP